MITWKPDYCPPNQGQCVIELAKVAGQVVWITPASIIALCARHQAIKDSLALTDTQIHRVLLFLSRRKERARWEAKLEMLLGEEEFVPYRVNADGSITLLTGASGALLTAITNRVNTALAGEQTAEGVPAVTVE